MKFISTDTVRSEVLTAETSSCYIPFTINEWAQKFFLQPEPIVGICAEKKFSPTRGGGDMYFKAL